MLARLLGLGVAAGRHRFAGAVIQHLAADGGFASAFQAGTLGKRATNTCRHDEGTAGQQEAGTRGGIDASLAQPGLDVGIAGCFHRPVSMRVSISSL
ncbi:hypothetical protein ACFJIU_23690 [Mesorhizobium sp. UC74_2]|uniref:hypothetical protein n=1 Tax=Mesorhizobium sp. UC74_2 TaxID=3350171 RepID=UPI0036705553